MPGRNPLHNLVHVLFGVMGIAAFAGLFAPRLYAQIVAISYGLLVILGSNGARPAPRRLGLA